MESRLSVLTPSTLLAKGIAALLHFLKKEHADTLGRFHSSIASKKVAFDQLGLLFVPGCTVIERDCTSGEWQAVRVESCKLSEREDDNSSWRLECVYTEVMNGSGKDDVKFGYAGGYIEIKEPEGSVTSAGKKVKMMEVSRLPALPIDLYEGKEELEKYLVERGRKWSQYNGVHHVHYDNTKSTHEVKKVRSFLVLGMLICGLTTCLSLG
jgi:hypothetical protein